MTTSKLEDHKDMQNAINLKTLYLIRHGEGWHNIGYESLEDPHLTEAGWKQTKVLRDHLAKQNPPLKIDVVLVSPLIRTLETAAGVFGRAASPSDSGETLMLSTSQAHNSRSEHAEVYKPANLSFIAHEGCRERVGPNPCDRRTILTETKKQFPGVDFSLIQQDNDEFWDRVHLKPAGEGIYSVGESEKEIQARGLKFLQYVSERPETHIAVVAHAGFLDHTLDNFVGTSANNEYPGDEFKNCELRVFTWNGKDLVRQGDRDFVGDWPLR